MADLRKIGMKENWIYEVIVSTYQNKDPCAAPIGVWTKDFNTLSMMIYEDSTTLKNIIREKVFVVNFPRDIAVFDRALFDKGSLDFRASERINAPTLKDAQAFIELKVSQIKKRNTNFQIAAGVVHIVGVKGVKLINRAEGLILESLILASRIQVLSPKMIEKRFEENCRIIRKVAPSSIYERIIKRLLKEIKINLQHSPR